MSKLESVTDRSFENSSTWESYKNSSVALLYWTVKMKTLARAHTHRPVTLILPVPYGSETWSLVLR
jgi:hypothetical protein